MAGISRRRFLETSAAAGVGVTAGADALVNLDPALAADVKPSAKDAGIRLCIETDSNLMPTAEVGLRLLERIGHAWIQINYDPGNVVYYAGVRPEEDIKAALGRIGHVHLKDKCGGKGVLDFPPLGEGELDIPGILHDLKASGFLGPPFFESSTPSR